MLLLAVTIAGCNSQTWRVTSVMPLATATCNTVQESDGLTISTSLAVPRPLQPDSGVWWEPSSPHVGKLLNGTYHCGIAQVTVERDPNAKPSIDFNAGDKVSLRVTHRHLGGAEQGLQALVYSRQLTTDGQQTVVFPKVIYLSAPGINEYTLLANYLPYPIHFGQWPQPIANSPIKPMGNTQKKNCQVNQGVITC